MIRILCAAVLACGLAWGGGAPAQPSSRPLTNADIESMLKAGLPQNTIVLAIRLAARRGALNFDTSPAALIELKKMGANEGLLDALLTAGKGNLVPGLPEKSGVYFETPSGWVSLNSFFVWPPLYAVSPGNKHMDIPVGGPHAAVQFAQPRPKFYVRGLRSAGWSFIKLGEKGSQRVLRVTYNGMFTAGPEVIPEGTRPADVQALGDDVLTVTPATDLDAGEYLLCSKVPEGRGLLQCEGFGIPPAATAARTPGH